MLMFDSAIFLDGLLQSRDGSLSLFLSLSLQMQLTARLSFLLFSSSPLLLLVAEYSQI